MCFEMNNEDDVFRVIWPERLLLLWAEVIRYVWLDLGTVHIVKNRCRGYKHLNAFQIDLGTYLPMCHASWGTYLR